MKIADCKKVNEKNAGAQYMERSGIPNTELITHSSQHAVPNIKLYRYEKD